MENIEQFEDVIFDQSRADPPPPPAANDNATFSYAALDRTTADKARIAAARIRELVKQAQESYIAVGVTIFEAKQSLGRTSGRGSPSSSRTSRFGRRRTT